MSDIVTASEMYNILRSLEVAEGGTIHEDMSSHNVILSGVTTACIKIIEEPLADGYRFRYEKEGRRAGRIKGAKSKAELITFPTIKVQHYRGPFYVIVSLVTIDSPYYPHPHNLIGEGCEDGIFQKLINDPGMTCCFSDLRIQCVTKKNAVESLKCRENRRSDPFGTGFSHSSDLDKINFNAVRLCFQVFLPDSNGEFFNPFPLNPVISTPIYGKKLSSGMAIKRLSHCSTSVEGCEDIIMLCGHVNKDDIEIIFYEKKNKEIKWYAKGIFSPQDVHYGVAISFKTPPYNMKSVREKINCFICLRRPSDGTVGTPKEFTLVPIKEGPVNSQINDSTITTSDMYIDRDAVDNSPNLHQQAGYVQPTDFENDQSQNAGTSGNSHENDNPGKYIYRSPNDSNRSMSRSSIDSDDVIDGVLSLEDFLNGKLEDEPDIFQGFHRKSLHIKDFPAKPFCGVPRRHKDSPDHLLNSLSKLSLDSNSKDVDKK